MRAISLPAVIVLAVGIMLATLWVMGARIENAQRATSYLCGYLEGQRVILSQLGMGTAEQAAPEQDECRAERFNAHNFGFGK